MWDTIKFYGIVDMGYVKPDRVMEVTRKMLAGGVGVIQLRAKNHSEREIVRLGKDISPLCLDAGIPFILNDFPHLVHEVGAAGVHVGQDDMSVAEARRRVGPGKWVGKSTHSLDQAELAAGEGPDYLGFGPLFATATKPDYHPIGIADIAEVHRRVSLPIFCIGGIKLENLTEVVAAGARRVVIVSGILQAEDIESYCGECLGRLP